MTFEELWLDNLEFSTWWRQVKTNKPPDKILVLRGPSPSGKTTIARAMIDDLGSGTLIGPYSAMTKKALEDMCILNQLLILDNIISIKPSLVDTMIHAAQGITLIRRILYTTRSESINMTCGIVLITTKTQLTKRLDLLDRTLTIDLPRLSHLEVVQ